MRGAGGADDLVAFGGASQTIRLWDTRSAGGTAVSIRPLGGHGGWVSAIAWSRESEHHLLSTSHDGCAKVWDVRSSPEALHAVGGGAGKLLCGAWIGCTAIATGGEDCKLSVTDVDISVCL